MKKNGNPEVQRDRHLGNCIPTTGMYPVPL